MKFPFEHPRLVDVAPVCVPWGWSYRGPVPLSKASELGFVWMGTFERGLVQVIVLLQDGPAALYMVSAKLKNTLKSIEGEAMDRVARQFFAEGATFDIHGHMAIRVL